MSLLIRILSLYSPLRVVEAFESALEFSPKEYQKESGGALRREDEIRVWEYAYQPFDDLVSGEEPVPIVFPHDKDFAKIMDVEFEIIDVQGEGVIGVGSTAAGPGSTASARIVRQNPAVGRVLDATLVPGRDSVNARGHRIVQRRSSAGNVPQWSSQLPIDGKKTENFLDFPIDKNRTLSPGHLAPLHTPEAPGYDPDPTLPRFARLALSPKFKLYNLTSDLFWRARHDAISKILEENGYPFFDGDMDFHGLDRHEQLFSDNDLVVCLKPFRQTVDNTTGFPMCSDENVWVYCDSDKRALAGSQFRRTGFDSDTMGVVGLSKSHEVRVGEGGVTKSGRVEQGGMSGGHDATSRERRYDIKDTTKTTTTRLVAIPYSEKEFFFDYFRYSAVSDQEVIPSDRVLVMNKHVNPDLVRKPFQASVANGRRFAGVGADHNRKMVVEAATGTAARVPAQSSIKRQFSSTTGRSGRSPAQTQPDRYVFDSLSRGEMLRHLPYLTIAPIVNLGIASPTAANHTTVQTAVNASSTIKNPKSDKKEEEPRHPAAPDPHRERIVVCLTTVPQRINGVKPVLESLFNQTLVPDMIYMSVPYERVDKNIQWRNYRATRRDPQEKAVKKGTSNFTSRYPPLPPFLLDFHRNAYVVRIKMLCTVWERGTRRGQGACLRREGSELCHTELGRDVISELGRWGDWQRVGMIF